MNSTTNPPENPEKQEEFVEPSETSEVDSVDESSADEPVVIEGDAVEVEDSDEDVITSDDESEKFPEDESFGEEEAVVQQPVEPAEPRNPVLPMVFGGLIAGAIGFGAAYIPQMLGDEPDQLAGVSDMVEANTTALSELEARIEEVGDSVPPAVDTSDLEAGVAALDGAVGDLVTDVAALKDAPPVDLSGIAADIVALGERITALEIEDGNASSAQAETAKAELEAFQVELQQMIETAQAQIVTAEEEAEALKAAAAREAAMAKQRADLAELRAAVDGGGEFTALVSAMDNVPAEIADYAKDGIPTMDVLQRQFPDAARSALGAVQTVPEDATTGQRLTAFLRRQTNARSITPRDGDDPDAVLSRAQALLGSGQLGDALAEVEALPEDARDAMAGWLTDAHIRQSALDAVDALSQKLN